MSVHGNTFNGYLTKRIQNLHPACTTREHDVTRSSVLKDGNCRFLIVNEKITNKVVVPKSYQAEICL